MNNFYDNVLTGLQKKYGPFSVKFLGIGPETTFFVLLFIYFFAAQLKHGVTFTSKQIEAILDAAYKPLVDPPETPCPPFKHLSEDIIYQLRMMNIDKMSMKIPRVANGGSGEELPMTASFSAMTTVNSQPELSHKEFVGVIRGVLSYLVETCKDQDELAKKSDEIFDLLNIKVVGLYVV